MTNQLFCYWLQGYFEIGIEVSLNKYVVQQIQKQLSVIQEPLGTFTQWLRDVCDYIESKQYHETLCTHFSPLVEKNLNSIFFHVIDNTYNTEKTREELQRIHDGEIL